MQFFPEPQILPQPPQLLLSAAVLTQLKPQIFSPPEQLHCPTLQPAPTGQTVPQLPQLFESVAVVVHPVPHCTCPAEQLELQ